MLQKLSTEKIDSGLSFCCSGRTIATRFLLLKASETEYLLTTSLKDLMIKKIYVKVFT